MAEVAVTLKVYDGQPVLVEIRCEVTSCRKVLENVVSAPRVGDETRWGGATRVQICQRHGEGAGWGDVQAWQERQRRLDKPTDRVVEYKWIAWADLRPAVEKARHTGRTQPYKI
jgi:hypothetical protein